MKNKGFTLPEILAVIILLSVLSVISVSLITNRVNSAKGRISEAQEDLILTAAKLYVDENRLLYEKKENSKYCIPLELIIQKGYLSSPIIDLQGNEIDTNTKVKAEYLNGNFDFKYDSEDCKDENNE